MTEDPDVKDAHDRLKDARQRKRDVLVDLRECYFFIDPDRNRQLDRPRSSDYNSGETDAGERMTSLAGEAVEDMAQHVIETFMPEHLNWCEEILRPGVEVDADTQEKIDENRTETFRVMRMSNFYGAIAQSFYPDIGHGTVGVWIDDLVVPSGNLTIRPVPAHFLEIDIGPDGAIDFRALVMPRVKKNRVKAVLKGDLPEAVQKHVNNKKRGGFEIAWCYWRDYETDEGWKCVVTLDKLKVWSVDLPSVKHVPLVVGRFHVDPLDAWAKGPTRRSLPELRQLDELLVLKTDYLETGVHHPWTYPANSKLDVEDGLEAGVGYPHADGADPREIMSLNFGGDVDLSLIEEAALERRIRRAHYVDFPEQRADTPPTATQWIDELVKAQRRLGLPGKNFFREFCAPCYVRCKHLLESKGQIEPVTDNGRLISLDPANPAERAQDEQDIQVGTQLLAVLQAYLPQAGMIIVDQVATAENFKAKMRDKMVVLNDPQQAMANLKAVLPMLQGGSPDGQTAGKGNPDGQGAGTPGAG